MKPFLRKLMWLVRRPSRDAALLEELQFHLEAEAEERQAAGLSAAQAKAAARRGLGNVALVQEDTRAAWGWTLAEQFAQDLRYAFRTMAANRLFSALAILSLALGIGANTAIFSFMDSILFRSLPVPDPQSLAVLNWHAKGRPGLRLGHGFVVYSMSGTIWGDNKVGPTSGIFPYPAFELLQKNNSVFSSLFAYHPAHQLNVSVKQQAQVVRGEYVSGNYFRGIGINPVGGRFIVPDDDRTGAPAVAVLSFRFSQKYFADPATAAGQSILINNVPFVIAGVTPPEFFGVDPGAAPDLYLPMHADVVVDSGRQYGDRPESYLQEHYYWIEMMGRLRPGIPLTQAQASLAPLFRQWVDGTAANSRERENLPELVVKEGAGGLDSLRRHYSRPLYVLMTLVALILAIACANVANLLLARAASRSKEMALRLSVGAGRSRLLRQLLTESLLLSSIGGALGVAFAVWGIRVLTLLLANGETEFTLHAELNWHVLITAAALSLLTGILFGLAPALQSTRVDVISAIKENRSGRRGRSLLAQALVVAQIAISLFILVAAGLFVRTLANLRSVDLGFNRENVLLFVLNARQAGHHDPEISTFYGDLQRKFAQIPGVRSATLSISSIITAGHGTSIAVAGRPPDDATRYLTIGSDFFKTMQIPILAGRAIDEHEQPESPAVAVVSEFFAVKNFGGDNPIGHHLTMEARDTKRDLEIVGVARNVRYGGLKGVTPPVIYIPFNQGLRQPEEMVYELRTVGDPLAYVHSVREIVHRADPRVPIEEIKTQAAEIDQAMNQEILFAGLCTGFALLALAIACVGLYGTVSYNVARRTGEIGIRMALGAQRRGVLWMVIRDVLLLAVLGLAVSVPATFAVSKFVASFLFQMKPNDPLALTFAACILLAAALVAGYTPARRASRIDPVTALRHE